MGKVLFALCFCSSNSMPFMELLEYFSYNFEGHLKYPNVTEQEVVVIICAGKFKDHLRK